MPPRRSGRCRSRTPFRTGPAPPVQRPESAAVTLQFVTLNDADLELEPVEELDSLLDQISAGEATAAWVAQRLRQRLGPEQMAAVIVSDFSKDAISSEEIDMFERFSERARRAMVLAQDEARALNHDYIGTEHVLLGLIQEGDGVGAKALANLGISAQAVRAVIKETIGRGHDQPRGHIPFTPRTKTVLELSHRESTQLGQGYIGTEHILLGLVREGEGVAAQCLTKLGADLDKVRQQVVDLLGYRDRGEALVRRFLTEGGEHSGNQPWANTGRQHHNLLAELVSLLDENERLHDEVARLRQTLRRHDLDPDA